jgi:molecular chaperone HtpG
MTQEVHSFQTEVQQLLKLMIHSLYSNKEIFLRELISNASDALDKQRFAEISEKNLLSHPKELQVSITHYPESKRLVIEDNGIGMTKEELIANLGTIANSGTKKFLDSLKDSDKQNAQMIGQFGVGFYSAFMVAENIIVESLSSRGGQAWVWESNGEGSYALRAGSRTERGTRIELVIKEEEKEFLEDWRIKSVVKKYSDYITYPIVFTDKENKEERLNKTTPVWAKNKRDNKPEDYNELYKQLSFDFKEPMLYEHISSEGTTSFQSVVFVPQEAPFDLYQKEGHGLHLYVKRVSIMEKCKELLPEYLRFVVGVVETDDLPLNVSREILQQNNKLTVIKKSIVKKVLNNLIQLSTSDEEKFTKFYQAFGPVLKEGFHFDRDNHESLAKLARFKSNKTGPDGWVTLKDYADRKAIGQTNVFYITGTSFDGLRSSPHLEAFEARGIEVLFLIDPIDEWVVMDYPKFEELSLQNITKGDFDLRQVGVDPEENKTNDEPSPEALAPVIEFIRKHLEADVKDVKVSKRLRDSAACLVADSYAMSAHMERIMRATNKEFSSNKKVLEINPNHGLIKKLALLVSQENPSSKMGEWVDIIYETALISEGSPLKNPGEFAKKLTRALEASV